jgi:hypothetical protein
MTGPLVLSRKRLAFKMKPRRSPFPQNRLPSAGLFSLRRSRLRSRRYVDPNVPADRITRLAVIVLSSRWLVSVRTPSASGW